MMDADVVVVGAGPAGAAVALLLARAGVRVLLLERRPFPRAKPCGDCLSAGAGAVLARLGVRDAVHALPHARLDGWRIVAPGGAAFAVRFRDLHGAADTGHALAVERAYLDCALQNAAAAAGAVLRTAQVYDVLRDARGAVRGVSTGAGDVTARVVVGADGLRSRVAARLGAVARAPRLRRVSLTAHLAAPALATPTGEMHVGAGVTVGVAAVAPHGRCNVTVVADARRFGRDVAHDPNGFAVRAVASLPRLRGRVPLEALRHAPLLASGPFDRPVRTVVFDGAALVGDAAGYFDPFTGQGIFQALVTGELLATNLLATLSRGPVTAAALRPYERARRRLLRGPRTVQYGIDLALRAPARADRAIALCRRAPDMASAIVAVTADLRPARNLLSPRALSSLLLPRRPLEDLA